MVSEYKECGQRLTKIGFNGGVLNLELPKVKEKVDLTMGEKRSKPSSMAK